MISYCIHNIHSFFLLCFDITRSGQASATVEITLCNLGDNQYKVSKMIFKYIVCKPILFINSVCQTQILYLDTVKPNTTKHEIHKKKFKKINPPTIICKVDTYGEKLTIVRTVTQTTSNYKIKERVDSKDSSLEKVACILGNFLFNEKTRAQKMGDSMSKTVNWRLISLEF